MSAWTLDLFSVTVAFLFILVSIGIARCIDNSPIRVVIAPYHNSNQDESEEGEEEEEEADELEVNSTSEESDEYSSACTDNSGGADVVEANTTDQ